MGLRGIFNPIVRAYFANKYAGSGGGAGGATTSVHIKKGTPIELNEIGMAKISDYTPTVEQLNGGIIVFDHGETFLEAAKLYTSEEDGIVIWYYGENLAGAVFYDDIITDDGQAEKGLYMGFGDTVSPCDVWIVWEAPN